MEKDINSKDQDFRVVVLISGRGSNFQALYRHINRKALAIKIVGVVSDQPSAAGLIFAKDHSIPFEVVRRRPRERSNYSFNLELVKVVEQFKPDLVVLAGFMRILLPDFINNFPDKIINIHPALLPSFKGLHAQQQAFEAGVKFTGATVHFVAPEVDAGPIIAQSVVPIFEEDSLEMVEDRILQTEHLLLPSVVELLANKKFKFVESASGRICKLMDEDQQKLENTVLFSIKVQCQ